jgi:hypothetical protein
MENMLKNVRDANYRAFNIKNSPNKSGFIANSSYLAFVRQRVLLQSLKRQVIPVGMSTYGLKYFPVKPP